MAAQIWENYGQVKVHLFASEESVVESGLYWAPTECHCHYLLPEPPRSAAPMMASGNWCIKTEAIAFQSPFPVILTFLQELLDKSLALSTVRKDLAAISACHKGSGDKTADKHPLICQIIEGARRLQTVSRSLAALWDLSLVLDGLSCPPFETVHQVGLTPNFHWILLRCIVSLQRWRSRYVSF